MNKLEQSLLEIHYDNVNVIKKLARGNEGVNEKYRESTKNGYYKFIPLSSVIMFEYLQAVRKLSPKSLTFLDVGCGIGNIMQLAGLAGFTPTGIEYNKKYKKYSLYNTEYIQYIDAFKFSSYDKYDVIYFYCPIADEKLELELETLIWREAKPGTIIIPILSKLHVIGNSVYLHDKIIALCARPSVGQFQNFPIYTKLYIK